MLFDHDLNLVWTPRAPEWKNARDAKVQRLDGNNYITFLYGSETSVGGQGYALVCSAIELVTAFNIHTRRQEYHELMPGFVD